MTGKKKPTKPKKIKINTTKGPKLTKEELENASGGAPSFIGTKNHCCLTME